MRLRDIIICSVCIIIAVTLLVTTGNQLDYINTKRQEMKLIINEPLENAPPALAFATVAMGAFRGLVVDVLWIRAETLKGQGQFFDAKQLAEWITTLQPRFAPVWEFQAWNMAYNISSAIPATQSEERWRWVKNGYELLREKGIELNPKSILLYRTLGLIFQHKIGGISDEAHKYYKLQLIELMEPVLSSADNTLDAEDNDYFAALAESPESWEQIVNDSNVNGLISSLKAADVVFADDDEFVNNYLSLRQNPKRFTPEAFAVIDSFRGKKELKKFDIFAKSFYLRDVWKLDPALMQELNQRFGPRALNDPNEWLPLDWRHPQVHAIYWAVKGLEVAGKEEFTVEETNTDRIVNHSLQSLFRNGLIFVYGRNTQKKLAEPLSMEDEREGTPDRVVFLRPDLRMFDSYNNSVLAVIDKYEDIEKSGTLQSLKIGHQNMLRNALLSFYQAGNMRQAEKVYAQLRQLYPGDDYKVGLVAFAKARFLEEMQGLEITNANEIVQLILRESFFRYAVRDDDEAAIKEKIAREIYDHYQSAYAEDERINLPNYKLVKYLALIDFLEDPTYLPEMKENLLGRIQLEKPELYKQLRQQAEKLRRQTEKTKQ